MATLELPRADASAAPEHAPADYYYRIPVRPIYKTFPVYRPDKELSGYFEDLQRQQPQVLWDANGVRPKLETDAA